MPTPIVKQHVWEGMGQPSETYLDHDPLSGHLGLSPAARFEMCLNCVWAKERRARGQLRLYPLRDWTECTDRNSQNEHTFHAKRTRGHPIRTPNGVGWSAYANFGRSKRRHINKTASSYLRSICTECPFLGTRDGRERYVTSSGFQPVFNKNPPLSEGYRVGEHIFRG
jgi:hypothetical protein